MTQEERIRLRFRHSEINKRLKILNSIANGTNIDVRQFVVGKNGEFSDSKFEKFLKKMLPDELCGKERRFYKAFLYCALRGFGTEVIQNYYMFETGGIYEVFRECNTFQDIIDKAELVNADYDKYKTYEELLEDEQIQIQRFLGFELGYEKEKDGFFYCMDVLYKMLAKKDFIFDVNLVSSDAMVWGEEFYPPEVDTSDLEENTYSETDNQWVETLEDAKSYVQGVNSSRQQDWIDYVDNFKDLEKFKNSCLSYRKLFFEVSEECRRNLCCNIKSYIESMIMEMEYANDPEGKKCYKLIKSLDSAIASVASKREVLLR